MFLLSMAAQLGPSPIRGNTVATCLDIANRSVFVIQMQHVYCAVRSKFLSAVRSISCIRDLTKRRSLFCKCAPPSASVPPECTKTVVILFQHTAKEEFTVVVCWWHRPADDTVVARRENQFLSGLSQPKQCKRRCRLLRSCVAVVRKENDWKNLL
jgi:hypothetical protein